MGMAMWAALLGCGGEVASSTPTAEVTLTTGAETRGGEVGPPPSLIGAIVDTAALDGLAGGPRDAASFGSGCVGFIPVAPQYQFELAAPARVSISASSREDATLVVVLPDGTTLCDDDTDGYNPRVTATLGPGEHLVFVGTYAAIPPAAFHLEVGPPPPPPPTIPGVPLECGMTVASHGPLTVGTPVVLEVHTAWDGPDGHGGYVAADTWWSDGMWPFVGMTALIIELGLDPVGCPIVYVDVDGGAFGWRIRNLGAGTMENDEGVFGDVPARHARFTGVAIAGVPANCGMATVARYGPVHPGMPVTLGAHTPWSGPDGHGQYVGNDTWWNEEMWAYVGQPAVVTELGGLDPVGCPYVRVSVDGGSWGWRIRDLRP
jgi:hypothetical protein